MCAIRSNHSDRSAAVDPRRERSMAMAASEASAWSVSRSRASSACGAGQVRPIEPSETSTPPLDTRRGRYAPMNVVPSGPVASRSNVAMRLVAAVAKPCVGSRTSVARRAPAPASIPTTAAGWRPGRSGSWTSTAPIGAWSAAAAAARMASRLASRSPLRAIDSIAPARAVRRSLVWGSVDTWGLLHATSNGGRIVHPDPAHAARHGPHITTLTTVDAASILRA